MYVVATAGHVDHGKSTLVRALTQMEPDRWAAERRRGLTIDLGYAWMTLPSGVEMAIVDVPGHQRFIGNMLAGVGPAPAVLFVVAADQGWQQQSTEHLAAIEALGITRAVLAVTRRDLASPDTAAKEASGRLRDSGLVNVETVAVSGVTGAGIDDLRGALDRLMRDAPPAATDGRVRLWVDRAFIIRGSGVVATGTLNSGRVATGDRLDLRGHQVLVRGVQTLGQSTGSATAVARVALNLRGVELAGIGRGDALLTPGSWRTTDQVDVRLTVDADDLPAGLQFHLGTAAVSARMRPLGGTAARLTLPRPFALQPGDRGLLRRPGLSSVAAGVLVLDVAPPALRRRGAARARAVLLEQATGRPDLATEVSRHRTVTRADLIGLGVPVDDAAADEAADNLLVVGDWFIARSQWAEWTTQLCVAVDDYATEAPLTGGIPYKAAQNALGLPDMKVLKKLVDDAGLETSMGRIRRPGAVAELGEAQHGIEELQARLSENPFAAPERNDLTALGLGPQELAAAARMGLIVRLSGEIVLLADGPAKAMRVLADLPQPFTASEARQALQTTRRVAIPLLEHLDARGWTRRVDGTLREIVR